MDVRAALGIGGDRWLLNRSRYAPGQRGGHYESFYQRANHPSRPLAFWVRYTIFAPHGDPGAAQGELWAVFFDGETGNHVVVKEEWPIGECQFGRDEFAVRIGDARLGTDRLTGSVSAGVASADVARADAASPDAASADAASADAASPDAAGAVPAARDGGRAHRGDPGATIAWDLRYDCPEPPLLLLPPRLYTSGIAKAKSLVAAPNARYDGTLTVNGVNIPVTGWVGSQNHNWGSRHADHYAFAQVAEFDGEPGSFLELITVRSRIAGPVTTPFFTFLVLRHGGREYAMTSMWQALRATGRFGYYHWEFESGDADTRIAGRITAERGAFVGLRYRNPPGGSKHCLNTKIAAAELTLTGRRGGAPVTLRTAGRALFEILTDDPQHGVALRA